MSSISWRKKEKKVFKHSAVEFSFLTGQKMLSHFISEAQGTAATATIF